jgi:hypothetical protein
MGKRISDTEFWFRQNFSGMCCCFALIIENYSPILTSVIESWLLVELWPNWNTGLKTRKGTLETFLVCVLSELFSDLLTVVKPVIESLWTGMTFLSKGTNLVARHLASWPCSANAEPQGNFQLNWARIILENVQKLWINYLISGSAFSLVSHNQSKVQRPFSPPPFNLHFVGSVSQASLMPKVNMWNAPESKTFWAQTWYKWQFHIWPHVIGHSQNESTLKLLSKITFKLWV